MIGRTVSHYLIKEQLGEGGMGVVYRAEDTLLGRHVAVKFLPPTGGGPQFRARFLREARAASALNHPNIATVHDYGETEDGEPFIVMELVEGRTLDAVLRSDPPPTLLYVLDVIERVAEALAEAHARGVIHRDIKPANVVVRAKADNGAAPAAVKVLDFGLAKLAPAIWPGGAALQDAPTIPGNLTAEHVVLGTPLYISPEQSRGAEVDARSDLFSLGATLYECVAGRPPFQGSSVGEIFRQVEQADPPPPSTLNPRVTHALDRVVLKALSKRPEDRHQSADEMLAELRAARTSLVADATSPRTAYVTRAGGTSRVSRALSTLNRLRRPRYYVPAFVALACAVAASMWAMRAGRVPPPHPKAVERFDEGTRALADGTYYKASKLLADAVEIDPRFALAHARLAEAWTELDYTARAMSSILTAQALARERRGLRGEEAAYLEAIDVTVRRDYPAAVRLYQEIAARSPQDPRVHVDLGRAHEKNEEADEAIKSYQKATQLDPHDAAAFLRLGVLLGRQQNLPAAEATFAQAEQVYQTIDNYEGLTEVYYQRGSLASRTGKLAPARALLSRALATAETTRNEYQQTRALLGLSGVAVKEGKTEEAKQHAARALELARAARIENLTAQGLVNLGRAYFLRRENEEAERHFKQALAFAEQSGGRRGAAQAHLALGNLYVQQERNYDEAITHLEQALAFFRPGGYATEVSQALLLSGRARLQRGDYEAALAEFNQQAEVARQIGDASQLVNSKALVGAALADRELYPEALHHFREGYEASTSAGIPLNAAYALLNQGDMLWRLGRREEARAALAQMPAAVERLDGKYKQLLLGRTQLVGALIALSERRLDDARKAAAQALTLADERLDAEAKHVLCAAQVSPSAGQGARRACDEAIKSAERQEDPRLVAISTLALAEATLEGGDARAARDAAQKALELFTRGGQQESGWRAWLVAARASLRLGEREAAREQLSRAEQTFSALERAWGAEAFRGYATRPDVQFYRRQLNEALAAVQ